MKIRVYYEATNSLGCGVTEIEVPDNASDSDKDNAALEAVCDTISIWWEDLR